MITDLHCLLQIGAMYILFCALYFTSLSLSPSCSFLFAGDSVYVRSDEEYPYMAKIDKIWMDKRYF